MSFTFVNSTKNHGGSSGVTTLAAAISGATVAAGDLIVAFVGNYGEAFQASGISDGTSAFSQGTNNSNAGVDSQFWYLLSSVATGTPTYTVTWPGPGAQYPNINFMVWRPTGTVSLDVQNATAFDASASVITGSITTTGTDGLAVAAVMDDDAAKTFSLPKINTQTASNTSDGGGTVTNSYMWGLAGSTFSGTATLTLSSSANWAANIISFKGAAAAGTYYAPTSTVAAGNWSAVGDATLYGTVDEIAASISDADYMQSGQNPTNDIARLAFSVSTAPAGTRTLHYRLWSDGGCNATVKLIEGASTVIQTWTHTPAPATPTTYDQNITGTITSPSTLKVEVTAN